MKRFDWIDVGIVIGWLVIAATEWVAHRNVGSAAAFVVVAITWAGSVYWRSEAVRMDKDYSALAVEYLKLRAAAFSLYYAGHWRCDRLVDEAELWERLRDAMGAKPGHAPRPIVGDEPLA